MRIKDYKHPAVQAACDAMHGGPSKPTKERRKAVMRAINAAADWFENEARVINYANSRGQSPPGEYPPPQQD